MQPNKNATKEVSNRQAKEKKKIMMKIMMPLWVTTVK